MRAKGVILVVEDTPESLVMLTDTLSAEGYQVRPADSGELALASVAAAKPELILLDIRMPGIGGFEVCRRLKAAKETRNIPVMFISAVNESEERVEGLRIGAVDFVSKPFCKEELLARIETHLELSRLRERLEYRVAERTDQLKAANQQLKSELAGRIRTEMALRESEARFRSMADTAPVVIWTSGPDTKVDFVNKYGLTFVGRTLGEVLGDCWQEVMHPEDLGPRYAEYIPVIQAHRDYRAEFRVRRADGEYRWMLDTASPRFLSDGGFAGYVGVMVDITDLKRNQEQLMEAQKLESLGVLAAGVAHNLNNQMGTILAEADLGLSEVPRESPEYGNFERISAVAMRVSKIVALLMSYAGTGATTEMPVNLSYIVEESLPLLKVTVPKTVTFCTDLAKNLPVIRADISLMRQIVFSLLANAAESLGNQPGSVRVLTSRTVVSEADIASHAESLEPGNYVRLAVTDSGCGISDEDRARIFDPFYSTKSLGRGLGLAAVRGIVRSFGGSIRVESALGRGSTFEVLLPCRDEVYDRRIQSAQATERPCSRLG